MGGLKKKAVTFVIAFFGPTSSGNWLEAWGPTRKGWGDLNLFYHRDHQRFALGAGVQHLGQVVADAVAYFG